MESYAGTAGEQQLLKQLNLAGASVLVSTLPDPFEAGHVVEMARAANPGIRIIARATNTDSVAYLKSLGADLIFSGQEQIAQSMLGALLHAPEGKAACCAAPSTWTPSARC